MHCTIARPIYEINKRSYIDLVVPEAFYKQCLAEKSESVMSNRVMRIKVPRRGRVLMIKTNGIKSIYEYTHSEEIHVTMKRGLVESIWLLDSIL